LEFHKKVMKRIRSWTIVLIELADDWISSHYCYDWISMKWVSYYWVTTDYWAYHACTVKTIVDWKNAPHFFQVADLVHASVCDLLYPLATPCTSLCSCSGWKQKQKENISKGLQVCMYMAKKTHNSVILWIQSCSSMKT
jgi:hypothetical protein